jgi:hypothetical protein
MLPHRGSGSPYGWLIFGVGMLVLALNGTLTGEIWARFGRIIEQGKEPKEFKQMLVLYYAAGVLFIAYFLYKIYGQ